MKTTNYLVAEMVHTVRQILFYVLSDVIEIEWQDFREQINKATLLETIIDAHNKFLKNIFKRSVQTKETYVRLILLMVNFRKLSCKNNRS